MFKVKRPISASSVGIGLRNPHHDYVLKNKPKTPFFEVHSENFFASGGPSIQFIENIRENYPLSLHGVGLSLGSSQMVDKAHLEKLKTLIKITDPFLISDHISWSNINDITLNDLLPIPYTKESLNVLCENIDQVQNFIQKPILVENPSSYLSFIDSDIKEDEFINDAARKTGCKILLDVNNVFVSSVNNNFDPVSYINNIKPEMVGEMHLAGHSKSDVNGEIVLIDTHDDYVCDEVWKLYEAAVQQFNVPTLIEWDKDLPEFAELENEARKAKNIIDQFANKRKGVIGG